MNEAMTMQTTLSKVNKFNDTVVNIGKVAGKNRISDSGRVKSRGSLDDLEWLSNSQIPEEDDKLPDMMARVRRSPSDTIEM